MVQTGQQSLQTSNIPEKHDRETFRKRIKEDPHFKFKKLGRPKQKLNNYKTKEGRRYGLECQK